jgi:hypothetical protein
MVRWSENLYLSDGIDPKKKRKLQKAIENGKLTFEVYCITMASNPNNLFDIINVNELLFQYYSRKDMFILGLATSKEEANLLVKDMIEEIYNKTGAFQVREYYI